MSTAEERKLQMQLASRKRNRSVGDTPYQYKVANEKFFDDGTLTWFWRPHTLTFVCLLLGFIVYTGLELESDSDAVNNRRGVFAAILSFLVFAALQFNDGPFYRPHPMIWRMVLAGSLLYEMFLIFILFQNPSFGRSVLKFFDSDLGQELPEESYADDCTFYDETNPSNPFHNPLSKADRFVVAHFLGWVIKALAFRDFYILHACSILFEFCEYTLGFQLPNFAECWWDHWIYDALLCNSGGIVVGLWLCKHLEMKEYQWHGISKIGKYKDKLKRAAQQFTPYSWTKFQWHSFSDINHWLATLFVCCVMLVNDLNAFYLKTVLWVPASSSLNIYRLLLAAPAGAVAVAEVHAFVNDDECERFGPQATIVLMIMVTETLISIKYGWNDIPWIGEGPREWLTFWIVFFCTITIVTVVVAYNTWRRRTTRKPKTN